VDTEGAADSLNKSTSPIRVKLTRLLVREVGELLNQIFVGLTQDVRLRRRIAQCYA
jgi:hypothetical protein